MASQILLTCVPLGRNPQTGVVTVDILVSPQLATQDDVTHMGGWDSWLQSNADKFTVQLQGIAESFPLKLSVDQIVAGVWDQLFQNARVGTAFGGGSTKTSIGRAAVSMKSSYETVHSFYNEVMLSRSIDPNSLGPDHEFLQTLHDEAQRRHGLQGAALIGNNLASPQTPSATASGQGDLDLITGRLAVAVFGEANASEGLAAPAVASSSVMQPALPSRALAGLAHLLDRIQSVPSAPVDVTLAAVPPVVCVSGLYSATLAPGNDTWQFSALPPGVTGSTNGTVAGTPTAAGPYQTAITVTDARGNTNTFRLSIPVLPARLPDGYATQAYSVELYAPGGTFTWSVPPGVLPKGLSIDQTGKSITGTPTEWPTSSTPTPISVTLTGVSGAQTVTRTLTIAIYKPLEGKNLLFAKVGESYSSPTVPGTPGNSWAIASGRLPEGLTWDSKSGTIAGTPVQVGTGTFRVVMKDNQPNPKVTEQDFILSVGRRHAIFVDSVPPGLVNQKYSVSVAKSTQAAYYYKLSSGALPAGIDLDRHSGILSGTPTSPTIDHSGAIAPATCVVSAYDSAGAVVGQMNLSLIVYPGIASAALPLNIYWPGPTQQLPQQLTVAQLGYVYTFQFIANAARPSWKVVAGSLPEGLTLDPSSGMLSGVARNAGTSQFTVSVQDGSGASAKRDFTLRVEQHLLNHVNRISSKPVKKGAGQVVASSQKMLTAASGPDFDQSIALLLNMPVLMRAAGLVLRGTFSYSGVLPPEPITLVLAGPSQAFGVPLTYVSTLCTTHASTNPPLSGLLPYSPANALTTDGWILPSPSTYIQGCIELDAEAQKQVQFGTRAGQRSESRTTGNAFHTADPAKVNVFDEDAVHSVLPPSPRTGGLQVWLHNRQDAAAKAVTQAQSDASNPTANPRSADTLTSGTAVDILYKGNWYPLTQRNEDYHFPNGITISAKDQVHGMRMSATHRTDTDTTTTDPNAFDIDETVFNWRLGSLVALPPQSEYPHSPIASKTQKPLPGSQTVPWSDPKKFQKTFTAPVNTPSPLFGETYQVSMRPVYITGSSPDWNIQAATQAALSQFTFQRYELIQGPELIPAYGDAKFSGDETKTLMMVGSRLDENLKASEFVRTSYRVVAPSRVSAEVARRHGYSKQLIDKGSTTIPLADGALPGEISLGMKPSGKHVAYLPDPLCVGVIATLTDLNGKRLRDVNGKLVPSVNLDYFEGDSWPQYTAHFIELDRADPNAKSVTVSVVPADYVPANFPFDLTKSKKILCSVPLGQTVLLYLHPKLDGRVLTQHVLAAKTSLGRTPAVDHLSFSDICRPTVVRLSHAVDRPSGRPTVISADWIPVPNSSVFDFVRTASNTMNLTVTAEQLSTSKVETSANWTDVVDDPTQPKPGPRKSTAQLAEFQIDKHTTAQPAVQPVRLPFSDTRYRRLTMNADAYSRFASCFENDKVNPKKKQLATGANPPVLVDVLATAPPPAPDVYMIRPSLHWEISETKKVTTRMRTAGLTLVLNRPWNTSGNFQKLALVVNLDGKGNPILKTADTSANADESTHSAWGFMPDFEYAGVAYFTQSSNGSRKCNCGPLPKPPTDAAIGVVLDDTPLDPNDPLQSDPKDPHQNKVQTIQHQGKDYNVSLYTPKYNEQDQQWYVNLRLGAPPAYGAVTRLIVANYQHSAVKGCKHSPFVLCDFALLSAQRSITLQSHGFFKRKVTVTVHGYGAYDASGNLFSQIEVRYISSDHDNFDWVEGNVITPSDPKKYTGDVLWQGTVDAEFIVGSTILVHEKEVYSSAESADKTGDRYVYADSFNV